MSEPQPISPRHDNAFDVLRLALSLLVVYTHARLIGGFGDDWTVGWLKHQTVPGHAAVLGFFGISGFLITQSFCSAPRLTTFLKRRALRILPGFYGALLFSAFVAAPLVAFLKHPGAHVWHSGDAIAFVGRNALLRIGAWTVGNELEGLPCAMSLNGALWSLYPEVLCYLAVLGLGLAGVFAQRRFELLVVTAILFVSNLGICLAPNAPEALFPSFLVLTTYTPYLVAFAVGATVYSVREHLQLGSGGAVVMGLLCAVLLKFGGWAIFGPVLLPLFCLHLAHCFKVRFAVDLSYGIYIFHFPCAQILAALNLPRYGFACFLGGTALVATAMATASWFCIERPALRWK